jgi:hypothetical protein
LPRGIFNRIGSKSGYCRVSSVFRYAGNFDPGKIFHKAGKLILNLLIPLIIVGSLAVGIVVFNICFELYKGSRVKNTSLALAPVSGGSTRETAKRMVKAVCDGRFLMHTLVNEASQFNDHASLERYKSYIRNPSVIAFIKNIRGWEEDE